MILRQAAKDLARSRKPRASGDDPVLDGNSCVPIWVNPARAGMIPMPIRLSRDEMSKPRASGDDPSDMEYVDEALV